MSRISEQERLLVYDVMAANGPDVDMWSRSFGRLVGQARKAVHLENRTALRRWLDEHGWFGPKSDVLRADGDRYY